MAFEAQGWHGRTPMQPIPFSLLRGKMHIVWQECNPDIEASLAPGVHSLLAPRLYIGSAEALTGHYICENWSLSETTRNVIQRIFQSTTE